MPRTNYGQTPLQRDSLRRQLEDFAKGSSQSGSARFFTKQDLIDFGVNDLAYPEVVVRSVIRELETQRVVRFQKEVTT